MKEAAQILRRRQFSGGIDDDGNFFFLGDGDDVQPLVANQENPQITTDQSEAPAYGGGGISGDNDAGGRLFRPLKAKQGLKARSFMGEDRSSRRENVGSAERFLPFGAVEKDAVRRSSVEFISHYWGLEVILFNNLFDS